jgi:hypothetical protein
VHSCAGPLTTTAVPLLLLHEGTRHGSLYSVTQVLLQYWLFAINSYKHEMLVDSNIAHASLTLSTQRSANGFFSSSRRIVPNNVQKTVFIDASEISVQ